jgi:hypothetical protein
MRLYCKPRHYKGALNEHILERIVHGRTDFAHILTPANVESALAEIPEGRDRSLGLSGLTRSARLSGYLQGLGYWDRVS